MRLFHMRGTQVAGSFAGCTATKLASGRQLRGCVADKALA